MRENFNCGRSRNCPGCNSPQSYVMSHHEQYLIRIKYQNMDLENGIHRRETVRLFWQLAITCHLATRSNDVSNNATMKIRLTMFSRLQQQATILESSEAEKQTDADSIFEAHQQQRRWCKIRIFRRWQDFLFSPSRIDDDYPTTCACTVTIMRSKLWYRRKKTKWPVRNESKMEECWLWEQRKTAEFGNYRSTEATVRKLVPSSKNWRWCHSPTTNPG